MFISGLSTQVSSIWAGAKVLAVAESFLFRMYRLLWKARAVQSQVFVDGTPLVGLTVLMVIAG